MLLAVHIQRLPDNRWLWTVYRRNHDGSTTANGDSAKTLADALQCVVAAHESSEGVVPTPNAEGYFITYGGIGSRGDENADGEDNP